MQRPDALDVVMVGGSILVALGLTVAGFGSVPEWLFLTICLTVLVEIVRSLASAWRRQRAQLRRVERALAVDPAAVALVAVAEERIRLRADIDASLRGHLANLADLVAEARGAADPGPALERLHVVCRMTTSDLRRQLGLLRVEAPRTEPAPKTVADQSLPGALAAGVVLLASVEAWGYPTLEDQRVAWETVILTAAVASGVLLRETRPATAAALMALLYAVGAATQIPVQGGFWFLAAVGGVLWRIVTKADNPLTWCAGVALTTSVVVATRATDPDNLAMTTAVLLVILSAASAIRTVGVRDRAAREMADRRDAELATVTRSALIAERTAVAREVHDLVSHAVGLVAVHAGLARLSWPDEKEQARRCLGVIEATVASARAQLNRIGAASRPPPHTVEDVRALAARLQAAGTDVSLHGVELLGHPVDETAYRVLQEGLTNVLRHAPGAHVHIAVSREDRALRISVTDDGPGAGSAASQGFGLVGLAERVAFASGSLEHGARAEGRGYRLMVRLPISSDMPVPIPRDHDR